MKKFILLLILVFISICAYCQEPDPYNSPFPEEIPPSLFIGTGSGINNFNAMIGLFVEGKLFHNFTVAGGYGTGFWGLKASIAARYYREYPYNVFYGLGFSSASGISEFELEMNTLPDDEPENVMLNFIRANTLNLSLGYQFKIFNKGRICFELGYGIRLQKKAYEVLTPDTRLTEASVKTLDMIVPGGLILGLGFSLGLN